MHVLVFQVHGLSAVLPLCYLCNSEVICGIVHLQPAAPFRLSHAGPVAHCEILFHLPPLWCQSAARLSPAGCSPSPSKGWLLVHRGGAQTLQVTASLPPVSIQLLPGHPL